MEDEELAQLRAQADNNREGNDSELQKQKEDDIRQSILIQILEPEAADRLGRIRLVKESRAQDVENRLITLAQTGRLRSKVTERQLKELLGTVAESREQERIVISRRKGEWHDMTDNLEEFMKFDKP